jgi:hypothetical protein
MNCPACSTGNPDLARFCLRCGHRLRDAAEARGRGDAYAVHPSENVGQFALISTMLPHTNRTAANDYRWALLGGAALVLVLSLAGFPPGAVAAAAFLLPLTYLIYMHDAELWQDRPGHVVSVLYLAVGAGAVLVSLVFFRWVLSGAFAGVLTATSGRGGLAAIPWGALVLFAVLLPLVSEIVKQAGAVWLASRPAYDDMIDGFTFGAASGAAYAGFESVIAFGAIFVGGAVHASDALGLWLVVILHLMIVKPVLAGAATGTAVAAFSGKGAGYDGFTPSYAANVAIAVAVNALYWIGVRVLAAAPFGQALGLLWGAALLAMVVVRARTALQAALLESALEDAAAGTRGSWATTDSGYCAECESILLPDSVFCVICGASVRAVSQSARRHARRPNAEPAEGDPPSGMRGGPR